MTLLPIFGLLLVGVEAASKPQMGTYPIKYEIPNDTRLRLEKGWNSWNSFKAKINQSLIEDTATTLVKLGLADAGYDHVMIDAGWQAKTRAANGQQQANATTFPSGIKGVADYVHHLHLKLGIYRFVLTRDFELPNICPYD